jgi:hypothetical protein
MKTLQSGVIALLLLCGFISCQKDINSEALSSSSKARLATTVATQTIAGNALESTCPECVADFVAKEETASTNAVLNLSNGVLPVLIQSNTIKTVESTDETYTVENVKVTVSHDLDNVYFTFERTTDDGFGNIRFNSPALTFVPTNGPGKTDVPAGTKKMQIVSPRNSLTPCSTVSFAFAVGGGGGRNNQVGSPVLTYVLRDLCPPVCTINAGDYRTHSRGYWRNNEGQAFLAAHTNLFTFAIGDASNTQTFSDPASVEEYLESKPVANGTPGVLPNAGTFGAQVLSLAINLKADAQLADYSMAEGKLGNLVVAIDEADLAAHPTWVGLAAWNGKSVSEIFTIAQKVLGGTSKGYTPSHMNEVVTAINEAFEDGTANTGFLSCRN